MDSVPVWVLTAVIEVSVLCTGALSLVTFCLWRRQRQLRARLRERQDVPTLPASPAVILPAGAVVASIPEPPEEPRPFENAAATVAAAVEEPPRAAVVERLEREATLAAAPTEPEQVVFEPVAAAVAPEESATATEAGSAASAAESPGSGVLTQDMLDALLAGALHEEPAEATAEAPRSAAEQSAAMLMAENTVMEQQLNELQEKNGLLRQSVALLLSNASLPLEQQQDIPVPEKTMQEMERGLAALQQTRQRMQQQLQAHCQLLGFDTLAQPQGHLVADDPALAETRALSPGPAAPEEVRQLQAALEQRTADYQRVQDEYEHLLDEYQRVFEHAAPAEPRAADGIPSQAA